MPTVAELQREFDSRKLIRKALRAVAVLAPTSVDLPEQLTGPDSLPIDLSSLGFLPVGMVTPDGWTFGREVEKDEINALGYASFVRSDINTVTRSITVTPLEFGRRHMTELRYGVDLSDVTQDANGEIVWDEPDLPINREYRLLTLFDDGPVEENWVVGKGFFNVKLSDSSEEAWASEGAVSNELTFDVYPDDETGSPTRHYLGGTGANAYRDLLGFDGSDNGDDEEPTP